MRCEHDEREDGEEEAEIAHGFGDLVAIRIGFIMIGRMFGLGSCVRFMVRVWEVGVAGCVRGRSSRQGVLLILIPRERHLAFLETVFVGRVRHFGCCPLA